MEKSGSSIFLKNLLISLTIIILSIVLVLLGMSIEKNRQAIKNNDDTPKTIEPEKTYEIISDNEINDIDDIDELNTKTNEALLLLMEQDNDVSDVKAFLEDDYYNDWIIYNAVSSVVFTSDDYNMKVTKDEVLKIVKEMYGYDLDLDFHDITENIDGSTKVGYKWDEKSQSYSYDHDTGAFQHGGHYNNGEYEFYRYTIFDKKITNDDNNVYTVTAKVLWNDIRYMTEGLEIPTKYYATYGDAKNDKNSIVTLTKTDNGFDVEEVPSENVNIDYLNDVYDYVYKEGKDKINTYEYKLVKEDGKIRVISYKLVK